MNSRIIKWAVGVLLTLMVVVFALVVFFLEPWVLKKIRSAVGEQEKYEVLIDHVDISIFKRGLALNSISIRSIEPNSTAGDITGDIVAVELVGINLFNAIFKQDFVINQVHISGLKGSLVLPEESVNETLSPYNIRIKEFKFSVIELRVQKPGTHESFTFRQGDVTASNLKISENEILSPALITEIDFDVQEFTTVSADSMYTISLNGIDYKSINGRLLTDSLRIIPSYKGYQFTARQRFQKDCIEANINNISISDFSAAQFLKDKSITCSYVELKTMNIEVFRDNRKEFDHLIKPIFQELIYDYPGYFNIDSVGVLNGNVSYTEHAEKANLPGTISFNDIAATVYKISNDTVYKSEEAFLEVKGKANFMDKGNFSVHLKAQLYDKHNTFSLKGSIGAMNIPDINQPLERIGYVSANSGSAQNLSFNFVANNQKSRGEMIFRYRNLDLSAANESLDGFTAVVQKIVVFVIGSQIVESNPEPGEEIRVGVIEFERDAERSFFNYSVKSILSGIKSSIMKESNKKRESQ